MQQPDSQGNFQMDCFGDDESEIDQQQNAEIPLPLTPEENPWFFDNELTPSEKAAAEIWAEQHNLYYYTL